MKIFIALLLTIGVIMATFSMFGTRTRVHTSGDELGCKAYLGEANRMLYQLRSVNRYGTYALPPRKYADGTVMTAWSVSGWDQVAIHKPFSKGDRVLLVDKHIITYADGDDIYAPFTRYLWSTENGKKYKAVPENVSQPAAYDRLGTRTTLTKDGLLWFLPSDDPTYGALWCMCSKDFGKTFEEPYQIIEFGDWTFFDVKTDEDGWIWIHSATYTWDRLPADSSYRISIDRLYVSKDKGKTFQLELTQNKMFAPVYLAVTGKGDKKSVYYSYLSSYNDFSVDKYDVTSKAVTTVYNHNTGYFPLAECMSLAANGETWVLMYSEESPTTGTQLGKIVRNGVPVWTAGDAENLYLWTCESMQIRNSGINFVAMYPTFASALSEEIAILTSTDDAATFSRTVVRPSGAGIHDFSNLTTVDIVGKKVVVGNNSEVSSISKVEIYSGDIGAAFTKIYEITLPKGTSVNNRGDVHIIKLKEQPCQDM